MKWALRVQFLSYNHQILGKFKFFKDVQMIVKSYFDIFNGIKSAKIQFQQLIQSIPRSTLYPSINICLSEMHAGKNSERITLLHGFTHVRIALKAQINGNENIGEGGYRSPYYIEPPVLKKPQWRL